MRRIAVTLGPTSAGGAATVYSPPVDGALKGIRYVPGTLDAGADITVTEDETSAAVDTVTNLAAAVWRKPSVPVVGTDGTAALYAAGGTAVLHDLPVVGRLKFVVASGGASVAGGTAYIYVE